MMARIRQNLPLTAQRLREVLDYDPCAGIFIWKVSNGPIKAGQVAGHIRKRGHRYLRITIDYHAYLASRLAFLYMRGQWPPAEIDHWNQDKSDTRWDNLRPATHSQNTANGFGSTKSGFKNIHRIKTGWLVEAKAEDTRVLKRFRCLGQAIRYRNELLHQLHGHYVCIDCRFEKAISIRAMRELMKRGAGSIQRLEKKALASQSDLGGRLQSVS